MNRQSCTHVIWQKRQIYILGKKSINLLVQLDIHLQKNEIISVGFFFYIVTKMNSKWNKSIGNQEKKNPQEHSSLGLVRTFWAEHQHHRNQVSTDGTTWEEGVCPANGTTSRVDSPRHGRKVSPVTLQTRSKYPEFTVIERHAKEIKPPINKWATELKRQFSKEEGKEDLQTDRQTDRWPVTIFQYP